MIIGLLGLANLVDPKKKQRCKRNILFSFHSTPRYENLISVLESYNCDITTKDDGDWTLLWTWESPDKICNATFNRNKDRLRVSTGLLISTKIS